MDPTKAQRIFQQIKIKAAPPVTAPYHTILFDSDIFAITGLCIWVPACFCLGHVCPLNDTRSLEPALCFLLCANGTLGLSCFFFFFYSPPPRSLTSFISVIPYKQDVGYTHIDKWRNKKKNQSVAMHVQATGFSKSVL